VLVPVAAHAGKVDEIRARGKLIVSVKNDAKKPHKDPAHAQKRGFEVELARAIAKRILGDDSKVEFRNLPRPSRLPMLAAGAVDLVLSMVPVTDDNARQCALSHPYFSSGLSLLLRDDAHTMTLADLAGKTVAFRKQSFNDYGAEMRRIAGATVDVRYYPSFEAAAAAVKAGQAAAMGGNFVDLDAWRAKHTGFKVNAELLEERRVAVAVKKGDDDLLGVVNEVIDELRKSGELRRMIEKWRLPYLLG